MKKTFALKLGGLITDVVYISISPKFVALIENWDDIVKLVENNNATVALFPNSKKLTGTLSLKL